jgi:uncharacterized heparinase superfamily protein
MDLALPLSSSFVKQPVQLWHDVRQQVRQAACGSPFYNWLLSSSAPPSQLAVRLADPWTGNQDAGRKMCCGFFPVGEGGGFRFYDDVWDDAVNHPDAFDALQGFSWLRDLRALGGDQPRRLARYLVDRWMNAHDRWDALSWRPDLLGQRVAMWLAFYDFFCGSADEEFQKRYFASLVRQARHLSRSMSGDLSGVPLLQAAKGLIYAGLSFPGREAWILDGFEVVLREIPVQFLSDGGHVSRSPQQLAEATRILLDLRYALGRAGLPVPEAVQHAVDRAGQGLKFFRYADKKLGLFHGGQEGDTAMLDSVLSQIAGPSRPLRSLPESGFERVSLGRSLLMFDVSSVPDAPYDGFAHSAPLSFEFACGRDRIFTNCGSHAVHPEWQQVLRHTAAHTAVTLGGRPAHDIHEHGGLGRRHRRIDCARVDTRDTCLLDAAHDAYARLSGISHRRRLYLCDRGNDLRGEDTLFADLAPSSPQEVAVRFHLHPRVMVSLAKDGEEVLLRLPSGIGWRFFAVGGKLSLENSIYLGNGIKPVKTRQIVLGAEMKSDRLQLKWALQRE